MSGEKNEFNRILEGAALRRISYKPASARRLQLAKLGIKTLDLG